MIDPLQTHVFAVGIGSYRLGDQWRLPNAAKHALAFVAWARASQVPRDHIHLFLSAPDRERIAAKIAEADVSAQAADYTTITSFVTHVLAVAGGELLYMFWTGHGSVSEEGRQGTVLRGSDVEEHTALRRERLPLGTADDIVRAIRHADRLHRRVR